MYRLIRLSCTLPPLSFLLHGASMRSVDHSLHALQ